MGSMSAFFGYTWLAAAQDCGKQVVMCDQQYITPTQSLAYLVAVHTCSKMASLFRTKVQRALNQTHRANQPFFMSCMHQPKEPLVE